MKMLLVGFGNMGQKHARKLVQLGGIEPAIVYRPSSNPAVHYDKRSKLVLSAFNLFQPMVGERDAPLFKTTQAAIASFKPDAAILATPTAGHYALAKLLLEARIPLLVEKPLTLSKEQDEELCALSRKNRTPLVVGYTERFNPAVVEFLAKYLPLLSNPRVAVSTRTSALNKPEHPFVDLGVHDMDIILRILDQMSPQMPAEGPLPLRVYASHITDGRRIVKATAHIRFEGKIPSFLFELNLRSAYEVTRVMRIEDPRRGLEINFIKKQISEKSGTGEKMLFQSQEDSLLQEHLFFQSVVKDGLSAQNPGPFDPWRFNLGTSAVQIMKTAARKAAATHLS